MNWLDSRWIRALCAGGTVLATVATSEVSWSLEETTPARTLTLASGATHEAAARVEHNTPGRDPSNSTSFEVQLPTILEGGQIYVTLRSDSCTETREKGASVRGGVWCEDDLPEQDCTAGATLPKRLITSLDCGGTVTATVRNAGAGTLALNYSFRASITANGEDDPPEDAYVTVEEVEP